jgi:hypothetical protein
MTEREAPRIVQSLLADDGKKFRRYFQKAVQAELDGRIWNKISKAEAGENEEPKNWIRTFREKVDLGILNHDEPWVTLVALYGLFGDQTDLINPKRVEAINGLLSETFGNRQGKPTPPRFDKINTVSMELKLPEIIKYRRYVHGLFHNQCAYHLYPDRKKAIEAKILKRTASLEGNTNLDALISGKGSNGQIHIFIEAKLMSDISKDITYVPVRNQIARTIDCAIDLMTDGGKMPDRLEDFWFLLLTPGIFRTGGYGGSAENPLKSFCPDKGRLYCYKMDDYLIPSNLRRDLPHWKGTLTDQHWALISSRIGWLTFEDIVHRVIENSILDGRELEDFRAFFVERCLTA